MHDAKFDDAVQRMVNDDGVPKGLKQVLIVRKVDVSRMNKAAMITAFFPSRFCQ